MLGIGSEGKTSFVPNIFLFYGIPEPRIEIKTSNTNTTIFKATDMIMPIDRHHFSILPLYRRALLNAVTQHLLRNSTERGTNMLKPQDLIKHSFYDDHSLWSEYSELAEQVPNTVIPVLSLEELFRLGLSPNLRT